MNQNAKHCNSRISCRVWISAGMWVCCLSTVLALCACVAQVPAEVTVTPEETPTIQTPAPQQEENPVSVFWGRFSEAYAPYQASMDTLADSPEQIALLDKALTVNLHMQRLQQVFLALTSLKQSEDELWDGILFGAMEGTGTITGTADNCTFSCTFSDASQIRGKLNSYTLRSEWLSEDWLTRRGEILHTDTGWYALVAWEDMNSLLYIAEDSLWFSGTLTEAAMPDTTLPPIQWADWGYQNGSFIENSGSTLENGGNATEDSGDAS